MHQYLNAVVPKLVVNYPLGIKCDSSSGTHAAPKPQCYFVLWTIIAKYWGNKQALNQLGTPGGARSFQIGSQIFWTTANSFKRCPTHFSRGAKNFLEGASSPLRPPGYGPCSKQGYHIPSLFLRFVLILQYYVLENITVLVTKKCPHCVLRPYFFLFSVA